MARKFKWTASEIQAQRGRNYVQHFRCRKVFTTLEGGLQVRYRQVASALRMPRLDLFGLGYKRDEFEAVCLLARREELDFELLNPWYVSDEGWVNFYEQWEALPEPVEFLHNGCVQVVDNLVLQVR